MAWVLAGNNAGAVAPSSPTASSGKWVLAAAPKSAPANQMANDFPSTDAAVGSLLHPSTPEQNRDYLLNLAAAAVPPVRFAKYLPEGANVLKAGLNYGTDVLQNAALGGAVNKLEGQSGTEGAISSGVGTAVLNPLMQTFQSGNPVVRLAGAGLLGLGVAEGAKQLGAPEGVSTDLIGSGVGAAIGLRGRNARDLAVMNLLKDVDPNRIKPRLDAANRLGLPFLRPSEAMDSGYIGGLEGAAGYTPEGALKLEQRTEVRQLAEKNAVNKLFNTTFDEKVMGPRVSALYKKAYVNKISPNTFNNLTKSATIRKAMETVDNNPPYQDALAGVPRNSIAYLDHVKIALDDMASAAEGGERNIITNIKNDLLSKLDGVNSTYKVARALAQRRIVRRDLLDVVNDEQLTGSSFYRKALVNDDQFDKIMAGLKNVPAAQKQAQDARMVFRVLVDSGKKTARSGVAETAKSMSKPRSSLQAFYQRLQGGAYDNAMVELMTSPDWANEVERAKKMAEPNEKGRYIANVISRITGDKLSNILAPN